MGPGSIVRQNLVVWEIEDLLGESVAHPGLDVPGILERIAFDGLAGDDHCLEGLRTEFQLERLGWFFRFGRNHGGFVRVLSAGLREDAV